MKKKSLKKTMCNRIGAIMLALIMSVASLQMPGASYEVHAEEVQEEVQTDTELSEQHTDDEKTDKTSQDESEESADEAGQKENEEVADSEENEVVQETVTEETEKEEDVLNTDDETNQDSIETSESTDTEEVSEERLNEEASGSSTGAVYGHYHVVDGAVKPIEIAVKTRGDAETYGYFVPEVPAKSIDEPGTKAYWICNKNSEKPEYYFNGNECGKYFEEDGWREITDLEEWKKGRGKIEYHEWDRTTGTCKICGIACEHDGGITTYGGQVCTICGLDAMYAEKVMAAKYEREVPQNYGFITREDILNPSFNLEYNLHDDYTVRGINEHPYTEPRKVLLDWKDSVIVHDEYVSWIGYIQQPVYFGTNNGTAQKWYIAGYQDGGLVLFPDTGASYGDISWAGDTMDDRLYESSFGTYREGEEPENVGLDHYGASNLRKALQSIAKNTDYFSAAEQDRMNTTRIYLEDTKKENSATYYVEDVLYIPYIANPDDNNYTEYRQLVVGANTEDDVSSGFKINIFDKNIKGNRDLVQLKNSHKGGAYYWLRNTRSGGTTKGKNGSDNRIYLMKSDIWKTQITEKDSFYGTMAVMPAFNLSMDSVSLLSAAEPVRTYNNEEVVSYNSRNSNNPQNPMYIRWDSALNADGTEAEIDRVNSLAVVTSTPWESYITVNNARDDEYLYVQYVDGYAGKVYSVKTTDLAGGKLDLAEIFGNFYATPFPDEMLVWTEKTCDDGLTYAKTAKYRDDKEKVYEISTAQDFLTVTNWSKNFIITNDIDFENMEVNPRGTLRGSIDGNGKKFKNIKIVETDFSINPDDTGKYDNYQLGGLFRNIAGSIRNLTLDSGEMILDLQPTEEEAKDCYYYGSFAGLIAPGGEISGCTNNLRIDVKLNLPKSIRKFAVGGIAGVASGSWVYPFNDINNAEKVFSIETNMLIDEYCGVETSYCVNNGNIDVSFVNSDNNCRMEVGGIFGCLFEPAKKISGLQNTGTINVKNVSVLFLYLGGICGRFSTSLGDVQNWLNSGDISCDDVLGKYIYIGGLGGYASMVSCYCNYLYDNLLKTDLRWVGDHYEPSIPYDKSKYINLKNSGNIYLSNLSSMPTVSCLLYIGHLGSLAENEYKVYYCNEYENNINTGNVYVDADEDVDNEYFSPVRDFSHNSTPTQCGLDADKIRKGIIHYKDKWLYTEDWLNYSGKETDENIVEINGQKYVKLELDSVGEKLDVDDQVVIKDIIVTDNYTETDKKDLIVTSIAAYAFRSSMLVYENDPDNGWGYYKHYKDDIKVGSIIVPETIETVGENAFGVNTYIQFLGATPPEGLKDAVADGATLHVPAGSEEAYIAALGEKADKIVLDTHEHVFSKGKCSCGAIEGKITNKDYPSSFVMGKVKEPLAENFNINSSATPEFVWYEGDRTTGDISNAIPLTTPSTAGTYTLVVKTGEVRGENQYSCAEFRMKVVISKAVLKGQVTINGELKEGSTLTAAAGVTTAEPGELSYQWYAVEDGKDIAFAGAITDTYVLSEKDTGKQIKVKVTSENCDGVLEAVTSGKVIHVDSNLDGRCDICGKKAVESEGIYIRKIDDQVYTGKAITPQLYVYDSQSNTELVKNKDYTVKYTNNVNVGTATVTLTAKGNYSSKETVTFNIKAADISSESFSTDDIVLKPTGREQKPKPVLKWNGKAVAATAYTYKYYKADSEGKPEGEALTAVKEPGKYVIVITAKENGNFTGTRSTEVTVIESTQKPVSALTVVAVKSQTYTGSEIEPDITVKDGKTTLSRSTDDGVTGDYTVAYSDNTAVGTAKVTVTGINKYVGTKTVTFKITGTSVTKATVEGITASVPYTGNDITFDDLKLYIKATKTTEKIDLTKSDDGVTGDYTVSYQKNLKAGTATVVFTGINGYSGVLKKTFKITPVKYADMTDRFAVEYADTTVETDGIVYSKGGAKPAVTVKFKYSKDDYITLVEKTDYTVSYTNNTAVNDCSNAKKPAVKITFKGSYIGFVTKNFKIVGKNIGDVTLEAPDKTYVNREGAYKSTVKATDTDGKLLALNRDYVVTEYSVGEGDLKKVLGPKDIVNADGDDGTLVTITVKAKENGNYSGETTCTYRVTKAAITSAKVATIKEQTYTGNAITLNAGDITVKTSLVGETLKYGTDYEIVPGSYTNNISKGTATVTIRGKGNYGGTRKLTFKIKTKVFSWWWRE